jgi:hypothetical protein
MMHHCKNLGVVVKKHWRGSLGVAIHSLYDAHRIEINFKNIRSMEISPQTNRSTSQLEKETIESKNWPSTKINHHFN